MCDIVGEPLLYVQSTGHGSCPDIVQSSLVTLTVILYCIDSVRVVFL